RRRTLRHRRRRRRQGTRRLDADDRADDRDPGRVLIRRRSRRVHDGGSMTETLTEQSSDLPGALSPLSGALGGLESTTKGALADVKPAGATLSSTGIARATDGLQGADFTAVDGPISAILDQARKLGLDLPAPTDLIAPLTTGLGAIERLTSGETHAALLSVRG